MPRRLLRLFLGVLALLQGLSPLLHAHVMPPDGGQTGLHVHAVAIGPAPRNCESTVSFTLAGVTEPAAILAPTEHRRDESLANAASAAPPCTAPVAFKGVRAANEPACVAHVPIAAALRLPPAQGPPAA
jgi:hypothetical protein